MDDTEFRRGYYKAVAYIADMYDEPGIAAETLQQYGPVNLDGIDDDDADILRRLADEYIAIDTREKCGIKHGFGDQTCIRKKGHDGLCRCKTVRSSGGTITYSEWQSRDGRFAHHVSYKTIYL